MRNLLEVKLSFYKLIIGKNKRLFYIGGLFS